MAVIVFCFFSRQRRLVSSSAKVYSNVKVCRVLYPKKRLRQVQSCCSSVRCNSEREMAKHCLSAGHCCFHNNFMVAVVCFSFDFEAYASTTQSTNVLRVPDSTHLLNSSGWRERAENLSGKCSPTPTPKRTCCIWIPCSKWYTILPKPRGHTIIHLVPIVSQNYRHIISPNCC